MNKMFEWIKDFLSLRSFSSFQKREYEKVDEDRKKRGEVWHYECENGHKWKSYSSPTSFYSAEKYGMEETCCPECGSTICKGDVYRNGIKTGMGARHIGFKTKSKK